MSEPAREGASSAAVFEESLAAGLPEAMPPYERAVLEGLRAESLPAFTSFGFES